MSACAMESRSDRAGCTGGFETPHLTPGNGS